MQNQPLVSVIIPCFNCQAFIKGSLQSVFNQTYKNFEVIVVDDGSTDKTKEILREYEIIRENFIYVYQNNKGPSKARNTGIANSSGKYIAFLDSDDLWKEEKLESQVDFLESNKECKLVLSNTNVIDEKGKVLYSIKRNIPSKQGKFIKDILLGNVIMFTSSLLFEKNLLEAIDTFNDDLKRREDHLFLINASYVTNIYNLDKVLTSKRINQSSISMSGNPENDIELNEIFFRQLLTEYPSLVKYKKSFYSVIYNSASQKYLRKNNKKKAQLYTLKALRKAPFKFKNLLLLFVTILPFSYSHIQNIRNMLR
jgi:glycosyltransferase involved in cell wall biosynthesis